MSGDLETFVAIEFKRCRGRRVGVSKITAHDPVLVNGIGRAFYWQGLIDTCLMKGASDIAHREGLTATVVSGFLRLTTLAPDLIEQIMRGKQPRALLLQHLLREHIPTDWRKQVREFGQSKTEGGTGGQEG